MSAAPRRKDGVRQAPRPVSIFGVPPPDFEDEEEDQFPMVIPPPPSQPPPPASGISPSPSPSPTHLNPLESPAAFPLFIPPPPSEPPAPGPDDEAPAALPFALGAVPPPPEEEPPAASDADHKRLSSASNTTREDASSNRTSVDLDDSFGSKSGPTDHTMPRTVSTILKDQALISAVSAYKLETEKAETGLPEFAAPLNLAVAPDDGEDEKEEVTQRLPYRNDIAHLSSRAVLYRLGDLKDVDRSRWATQLSEDHPEIAELQQRLWPLHRAHAFSALYAAGDTVVKETLNQNKILQLILQHLEYEGLSLSKRTLLEEMPGLKNLGHGLNESRLVAALRAAIKESSLSWRLLFAERYGVNLGDAAMGQVNSAEEFLMQLGVLKDEDEYDATDTNIWEEPPDNPTNIILTAGKDKDSSGENEVQVKAGSLNKLVERLTSAKRHDYMFMKTFLMTYRSFTTPAKFFTKLVERYHVPPDAEIPEEEFRRTLQLPIQLRVCNVMNNWMKQSWADFDEKLINKANAFIETLSKDKQVHLAKQLRGTLNKMAQERKDASKKTIFQEPPPDVKVPRNIFNPDLQLYEIDEEEIARQMTLMEFAIYSQIKPTELLNQNWSRAKYRHRSPNVVASITRFNEISSWVIGSVMKVERVKKRAKTIARFIRIAECLRKLNNFNSLMAVLSGLNSAAVHRLKFTRELLPARTMEVKQELEAIVKSTNAYKAYRETLHNVDPPCIPYLGVYLTDLTFIGDGNPNYLKISTDDGGEVQLINFFKRKLEYNVILEIQQYQQTPYNLQKVYQIQSLLRRLPSRMDENEAWHVSLDLEPRGADRTEIL